jgi:hypothetical protein
MEFSAMLGALFGLTALCGLLATGCSSCSRGRIRSAMLEDKHYLGVREFAAIAPWPRYESIGTGSNMRATGGKPAPAAT